MSKTQQREATHKAERERRYQHGVQQAAVYKEHGHVDSWYPKCMAWRAGFLHAGGKKFWKK